MTFYRLLAAFLLAFLVTASASAKGFDAKANYDKFEYRIPMRDGVHLFTAVYVPKDASAKYPILLTRTPYSISPYGADAFPKALGPSDSFAEDKFIFVYQDVRGRFMSEGSWLEMTPQQNGGGIDESTDTYDTIDWLIKNVGNNNGKVGLVGISYPGFYTSAGMIHAHPALLAASPQAPMSDIYMGDDAYHNGALFLIGNFSFYTDFNRQNNPEAPPRKEKQFDYGTKDGYQFYLRMGPVAESEKLLNPPNGYWNDVVNHPNYDSFWKARDLLPHLTDIKPAVLVVGGWFDAEDLSGALKTYRTVKKQSPATNDKLVMGPWVHGGWQRSKGDKLGDVSFDSNTGEFFRDNIELPFFQHYLKGAPDPDLPTAYMFETGKNIWTKEAQWPPSDAKPARLYLRAEKSLSASAPDAQAGFDEYSSDPSAPVPFYAKPTLSMNRDYMDADQRFVDGRPDVLTYQGETLANDFTVAGPIAPTLFVSSTGSDADFVVKLIDVDPSGYEQLVRGEPFRAKFRESFEDPKPLTPGKMETIHFSMPDVYHCFRKGHRVMLQIQSSWFPLVDRNPQTFTNIPTAKPSDFVKATQRVYRESDAASYVEVLTR